MPRPLLWSVWAAPFASQNYTAGETWAGTHDRSARAVGFAAGLDYHVTPYTVVGFALAGGRTDYGLSEGLGAGRSTMFQSAVYSLTRKDNYYISTAVAYAWHGVTTDRFLGSVDNEHLTGKYGADNVGGRLEGGYRFAGPGFLGQWGFGITPYGALQGQIFSTPSYRETAAATDATFALAYNAHATDVARTELGAWFDLPVTFSNGTLVELRTRAAWAHDEWSDRNMTARFESLSGTGFTVVGAVPVHDSMLASASAEVRFANRVSLTGTFDGEFTQRSQTYGGYARLRYIW